MTVKSIHKYLKLIESILELYADTFLGRLGYYKVKFEYQEKKRLEYITLKVKAIIKSQKLVLCFYDKV